MSAPVPWIPRLIALGSAAGLVGLVVITRSGGVVSVPLPPLRPFSQSSPTVAPATPSEGADEDPRLRLERLAAETARGGTADRLKAACAGVVSPEVCAVLVAHPDWGLEGARRVADGQVVLGSTAAQVEAAWGAPEAKRAEIGRTVWCYDEDCASGMYFLGEQVVGLKE